MNQFLSGMLMFATIGGIAFAAGLPIVFLLFKSRSFHQSFTPTDAFEVPLGDGKKSKILLCGLTSNEEEKPFFLSLMLKYEGKRFATRDELVHIEDKLQGLAPRPGNPAVRVRENRLNEWLHHTYYCLVNTKQ